MHYWWLVTWLDLTLSVWGRTLKKALQSYGLQIGFVKWREMAADWNQWCAICGSKMPSATKETPLSSRQDIWTEHRYGTVPSWVQKLKRKLQMSKQNEQKEREKYIQSDQPAWKPGGASATPQSRNFPVFDCAVALCTMQNALSMISNLTWLDLFPSSPCHGLSTLSSSLHSILNGRFENF
jgi:hypothetical protein